jgi:DNA-binding CsgD family transcriptional regulator
MTQIRKFIEWLSFHPSSDEIARALVTEYLIDEGVKAIRFGRINSDDSAMALGQFGYADADEWRNLVVPGSVWREWATPEVDIITGKNKTKWSPDSLTCVVALRDRGVMQGNIVVEFSRAVSDTDKPRVLDLVEDFCIPISLFLSFQNRAPGSLNPSKISVNNSRDVATDQLSARQVSILRGMVEGKTNHELATELGFSVSTVRHETMRIYQALGVSDRKEAAKKALALSII